MGPLQNLEICINVWWFVDDARHLVTHWAAKPYALRGEDADKFSALRVVAGTDYASVVWQPVPAGIVTVLPNGRSIEGAIPFTDRFRDDPARFDLLLESVEAGLPTHPTLGRPGPPYGPMALGEPFLSVETIVKYDANGLIGPVVGEAADDGTEEKPEDGTDPLAPFYEMMYAAEQANVPTRNVRDYFPTGPSVFHGLREMPRGHTLAFRLDALEAAFGTDAIVRLRAAVADALRDQGAMRPILAACALAEEVVLVVFGGNLPKGPTKAAAALRRFTGYMEEGEQTFDPEFYRPFVLWEKGKAHELSSASRFSTF